MNNVIKDVINWILNKIMFFVNKDRNRTDKKGNLKPKKAFS